MKYRNDEPLLVDTFEFKLFNMPQLPCDVLPRHWDEESPVPGIQFNGHFCWPKIRPTTWPKSCWSFETCLNLWSPSVEIGPECGPGWRPVLIPKFKVSIELHPSIIPWSRRSCGGATRSPASSSTPSTSRMKTTPKSSCPTPSRTHTKDSPRGSTDMTSANFYMIW